MGLSRLRWSAEAREIYKDTTVQISQNIEDKTMFDVLLGERVEICFSTMECEKLELALLGLEGIEVGK